jgi:putative membrane protein
MYGFGAGGWGMGSWGMVVLMMLFWVIVVGGIVAAIITVTRSSRSIAHEAPTHKEAERILHERFARGEVDEAEYVARRNALRNPHD